MPLIRKEPAGPVQSNPHDAASRLQSGTADERRMAARALGSPSAGNASSGGSSDGTKALGDALKTETDPRVREAIFTSLVRIGGGESVAMVVPYVRSENPQLRTEALDALHAMIADVRPVLPALLADRDADIRILTCDLVRDLPSADATRLLCDVLSRETEANVCAAAVDVLAEIGEAEALPFLRACAVRFADVPFLAFAVKLAVRRILAERGGSGE